MGGLARSSVVYGRNDERIRERIPEPTLEKKSATNSVTSDCVRPCPLLRYPLSLLPIPWALAPLFPPYNSMIAVVVYQSLSFPLPLSPDIPPPSLPFRQFRTGCGQYGNIYHISYLGIGRANTIFLYFILFLFVLCAESAERVQRVQRVQFVIRENVCEGPGASRALVTFFGGWQLAFANH